VRAYVGQTRAAKLVRRLWEAGIGECTVRGELPPRRHPWFFDNGAFGDWKAGRAFDSEAFEADLQAIERSGDRPDFIVAPDIVAGGMESLEFSKAWLPRLQRLGVPLYLAVQDGMGAEIGSELEPFAGIFIGGTLPWKLKTGRMWAALAKTYGLKCHIGRCGTARRIQWAKRLDVDSVDSALPLWSEDNLQRFFTGLRPTQQLELTSVAA
jgi:hypothetical protein